MSFAVRAAARLACGGALLICPPSQIPARAQQPAPPPVPTPAQPAPPPATAPIPTTPPTTTAAASAVPTAAATPNLPGPIQVPPPPLVLPFLPFPSFPAVPLDEAHNGIGIAQQMTRTRGLQARVLWIDGTANLDKINTSAKISALVARIKWAGFNTIVLDIKPIIGYTLYPSKYAPKMTEWVRPWGTQTLPADFDPLKEFVTQAKAQNIALIVNMNVFSEGHREFRKGPGYDNPQWQTVLYEPGTKVRRDVFGTPSYPIMDRPNLPPRDPNDLALYTDLSRLKPDPNALIALVDRNDTVVAQVFGGALGSLNIGVPPGGAAIVASSAAAVNFLRLNATPGYRLTLDNTPLYVPISQRPDRQVPLMMNPNSPEVRQRFLNMLTEVATNYEVDGFIFDDRLRYAALNADFSDTTRHDFETYLGGKTLRWPDDVFHYEINFPTMERAEVPGPYYDAWLVFRALTIRNFLAECVRTIKTIRPSATVATYVGSWYPDYPDVGANWAADDLQAGFRFLNDSYKKTGWAGLVDFVTTGCYYDVASIYDAAAQNSDIGETVEAAGQFSNRAVNDQTFVYAGIALDKFKNRPEILKRCLQAAAATTQGIMVFDLSHDIEPLWPIFSEAFARPAQAPHQVAGLVSELRAEHEKQKAAGVTLPPVILYRGSSGTGF